MTDQRKNRPSGSDTANLAACPGKWQAEQGLPELRTEEDDAYSSAGDRMHAVLSWPDELMFEPSEDESYLANQCETICTDLVNRLIPATEGATLDERREERYWLSAKSTAEVFAPGTTLIFSGQIDRLYICGQVGLIVDFKSLYGHQTSAEQNMQLRAYAVLAAAEYDLQTVHCAIVQPKVTREPVVVTYDADALGRAEAELRYLLGAVFAPGAPRAAGPQCKYCRARMTCPEALAATKQVAVFHPERKEVMPLERITYILEMKPAVESVIRAAESKARAILSSDPNAIPGWELAAGKEVRTITDMSRLFAQMVAAGVTEEEFQGICETTFEAIKGALKKLDKKTRPKKTNAAGKDAPINMNEFEKFVTEGCWTKKRNAPVLVRTGEAITEGEE